MKILRHIVIVVLFSLFSLQASGISVDAGLTPGQDRWMIRTQYRFMEMENPMMTMQNHMVPMVLAYGVSSNFTLMFRSVYVNRIVKMNKNVQNEGLNDAYFLLKLKVFRRNTAKYIIGVAPYIASNIPIGNPDISKRTWNPDFGLSISYRPRPWSIDFASSYSFIDVLNKTDIDERNNLSLNIALSSVVPIKNSDLAFSPVLELTYNTELGDGIKNQELLFLSPGLMFIKSSVIIEFLYQNPIFQQANESLMKANSRFLLGLRYMF